MLYEWIRNNKKKVIIVGGIVLVVLLLVITLIDVAVKRSSVPEESELVDAVLVSNIDVLYGDFSDSTIGYILNATRAAIDADVSMANGSPASEELQLSPNTTNDELYPGDEKGIFNYTIENDKIEYYEDEWGMWKTFVIKTSDNKRFKVNVSIGAHNRDNDVGYTQISVLKQ